MLSTIFTTLSLSLLATAQSTMSAYPAMVTVTGGTQDVSVGMNAQGEGALAFNPEVVHAKQGDKLVFHFYPRQHSVSQSTFSSPCAPSGPDAIFSGFYSTTSGVNPTTFTVTVNNTDPVWIYCSELGHCNGGMVMAINPPTTSSMSFAAFQKAAIGASNNESPKVVQGGVLASGSGSASSSSTGSGSSSTMTGSSSTMTSGTAGGATTSSAPTSSATMGSDGVVAYGSNMGPLGAAFAAAVGVAALL